MKTKHHYFHVWVGLELFPCLPYESQLIWEIEFNEFNASQVCQGHSLMFISPPYMRTYSLSLSLVCNWGMTTKTRLISTVSKPIKIIFVFFCSCIYVRIKWHYIRKILFSLFSDCPNSLIFWARNWLVMLSVSYTGKYAYSAGDLRVGALGVLVHCEGWGRGIAP